MKTNVRRHLRRTKRGVTGVVRHQRGIHQRDASEREAMKSLKPYKTYIKTDKKGIKKYIRDSEGFGSDLEIDIAVMNQKTGQEYVLASSQGEWYIIPVGQNAKREYGINEYKARTDFQRDYGFPIEKKHKIAESSKDWETGQ